MPSSQYERLRGGLDAQSKRTIEKLATVEKRGVATKAIRKRLRDATNPIQRTVRNAARALPSSRSRRKTPGGSLRNALASAVVRKIKVNSQRIMIVITVIPRGGKSNLGRIVEGEITPWTHPVYGHEDRKVTQEHEPFFYRTINAELPAVSNQIDQVLSDIEKQL